MEITTHIPVLCHEVVSLLGAEKGGNFLDCTLGGGGHALAVLQAHPKNTVVAVDRDARALIRANRRLEQFEGRIKIMHGRFSDLKDVLSGEKFDGILADLGLSTDQLKENRGFSFNDNAELDMRMDESQEVSALQIVNKTPERELMSLLRHGGVGREAAIVAKAIVAARPIEKTSDLSKIINRAVAGKTKAKKINPSTIVFQAIRIAVNNEYEEIESLMQGAPSLLKPGGRLVVISFHSLEDKIVARCMREWESRGNYPALWRGTRKEESLGRHLTRKAILAGDFEVQKNPSARSARLRVFEVSKTKAPVAKQLERARAARHHR